MIALADTSAWIGAVRRRDEAFFGLVDDGAILACAPVELELLVGLPSPAAVRTWRGRFSTLPAVRLDDRVVRRASETVELLAAQPGGQHRETPTSDLLIAACAEVAGVPLLHDDRHFERIAAVTGQDVRRVPA